MEHIFKRKINYYETDKMGVVHHSNYIRFLEEARCAFLNDIGIPYNKLEEAKIMIPVIEVNCKYKHSVTFADTIMIKTSIKELTGVKFIVEYNVIEEKSQNTVITAETKHCFTDENLKPVNLKKYNSDIFKKISSML